MEEAFRQELKLACYQKRIKPMDKPVMSRRCSTTRSGADLSGCMESLADACEGILWENDGQIVSWDGTRKVHDKKNPRVEFAYRETGDENCENAFLD